MYFTSRKIHVSFLHSTNYFYGLVISDMRRTQEVLKFRPYALEYDYRYPKLFNYLLFNYCIPPLIINVNINSINHLKQLAR